MLQTKPNILLLFTNHRIAEKLYDVVPELSKSFTVDLFSVGLFSQNTPWVGNKDERVLFKTKYKNYFRNIIEGPGVKFHGDNIREDLSSFLKVDDYSLVLYDDNRLMQEFNIPSLYSNFKKYNIPVVANPHGNEEYRRYDAVNKSFDHLFTFGYKEKFILENNFNHSDLLEGGIPNNDKLSSLKKNQKHILIITNFLGNRSSIFPVNFDRRFVEMSGVEELSRKYHIPVVVKQKARLDDPDFEKNVSYIKSLLNCQVVTDTDTSTDQLIADSKFVISSLSTLAFKPIQLNIPTVLIKGTGQVGNFYDYPHLVDLDKSQIFRIFKEEVNYSKFISHTIAGGDSFDSSRNYVAQLRKLYENNI